jgi:hypothetical protein
MFMGERVLNRHPRAPRKRRVLKLVGDAGVFEGEIDEKAKGSLR